jgi:tetratricopeptide (TPR) repeat protein
LFSIAAIALAVMGASSPSNASAGQSLSSMKAAVNGVVEAPDAGSPLLVRVELQSISGGIVQATSTDPSGNFSFSSVPLGAYVIVVKAAGYETGRWPVNIGYQPSMGLTLTLTPITASRAQALAGGSSTVSVRQLLIPEKAREEYRKAVDCLAHGKTDEAVKHWEKSVKIFPKYAESYMQLSRIYANRGDFARAEAAANNAIAIDDKDGDSYTALGYVYLKQNEFGKAKEPLQKAVQLSDTNWFSQLWYGKLLLDQKDAEGAYPHLLRAAQLKPEVPEADLLLYNALLLLRHPREALARIDDFLARFPNNPFVDKARAKRDALARALENEEH